MPDRRKLGDLDRSLLLALLQLEGEAYGIELQDEIAKRTGRRSSLGATYAALNRLEASGFLTSRLGEPAAVRGGRRKRFFALTAEGEDVLAADLRALRSLTRGLSPRFRLT